MLRSRIQDLLRSLFSFSRRERKRVLLLLPLLVALCLLFARLGKPCFEKSFTLYSDRVLDSVQANIHTGISDNFAEKVFSSGKSPQSGKSRKPRHDSLFTFDPNTATLEQLIRLGFSPKQARVILNYRDAGAVFRHKEDFARCYTVSTEKFAELAPYIRIDQTYSAVEQNPHTVRAGNRQENKPETDTAPDTNRSSPRPDTAPVPIPAGSNPDASPMPLRGKRDEQSRHAGPVELNSADSAALVSIRGIGPLTAGRIIRYRNALGGFASVSQLQEVTGMTDRNYQMILQQIFVDCSKIQKIDINFASPKRMQGHPYLPPKALNKILKFRQLKGGWSDTGDLIEQHILSAEEAERLEPYLCFGTH